MHDGINIWSGSTDPLGAALTNPTEISLRKGTIDKVYQVEIDGKVFSSAETAYLTLRSRPRDDDTMIKVIIEKLNQHPELVTQIEERGGEEWLFTCSHYTNAQTERFKYWEGTGAKSPFIYNLVQAYQIYKTGWRWPETPTQVKLDE